MNELQHDARLSYSELGRRINLSAPAVVERVRRMEEAGIITGYHAAIDPIQNWRNHDGIHSYDDGGNYDKLIEMIRETNEILECTV